MSQALKKLEEAQKKQIDALTEDEDMLDQIEKAVDVVSLSSFITDKKKYAAEFISVSMSILAWRALADGSTSSRRRMPTPSSSGSRGRSTRT